MADAPPSPLPNFSSPLPADLLRPIVADFRRRERSPSTHSPRKKARLSDILIDDRSSEVAISGDTSVATDNDDRKKGHSESTAVDDTESKAEYSFSEVIDRVENAVPKDKEEETSDSGDETSRATSVTQDALPQDQPSELDQHTENKPVANDDDDDDSSVQWDSAESSFGEETQLAGDFGATSADEEAATGEDNLDRLAYVRPFLQEGAWTMMLWEDDSGQQHNTVVRILKVLDDTDQLVIQYTYNQIDIDNLPKKTAGRNSLVKLELEPREHVLTDHCELISMKCIQGMAEAHDDMPDSESANHIWVTSFFCFATKRTYDINAVPQEVLNHPVPKHIFYR